MGSGEKKDEQNGSRKRGWKGVEGLSETAADKLVITKPLSRGSKERGHSRASVHYPARSLVIFELRWGRLCISIPGPGRVNGPCWLINSFCCCPGGAVWLFDWGRDCFTI